ncbi:hypothetical protein [Halobacteriovorax sp.]|uniref:mechanosensitive ion channel family protein n=1 Tax=Halobacteriovorax sp. TaxID=2020862 RepID=UPI003567A6DB
MLDEVLSSFSTVQTELFQLLPKLALSLTILIIGTILAYLLKWLGTGLIRWTSKVIPKNLLQKIITRKEIEKFSTIFGKVVFFITIFLSIATALKKLGLEIVSTWFENIASYLPNTIAALVIFVFGWKLKDFLEDIIYKSLTQVSFNQAKVFSKAVSWTVFIISTTVALEQVGLNISLIINLSIMLAGIVAGGIALTFALGAKSNITDILSCYQIAGHMKIGEEVTIAKHRGIVKSIGPVFVILESEEGRVALPGNLFNKNILTVKKV